MKGRNIVAKQILAATQNAKTKNNSLKLWPANIYAYTHIHPDIPNIFFVPLWFFALWEPNVAEMKAINKTNELKFKQIKPRCVPIFVHQTNPSCNQ